MIPPFLAAAAARISLKGILIAVAVGVVVCFAWSWHARGREVVRLGERNTELVARVAELGSGLTECRAINGRNGQALQACSAGTAALRQVAESLETRTKAAEARAVESARVARGADAARRARQEAPAADEYQAVLKELSSGL